MKFFPNKILIDFLNINFVLIFHLLIFQPLNEAQLKDVTAALQKFAGKKTVLLTSKVDPSILGGLIVSIGDKYVDMSIASKVKKYTEILNSVV